MPSSFRGIAPCRSSSVAKFQPQCGSARPSSTTTAKTTTTTTTTTLSQDRRCRRPSTSLTSSSTSTRLPRPLLPRLRAIGFDLLGGRGDSNNDDNRNSSSSPLVPGSPSSSSSTLNPRELLLAAGRLILLRDLMTEAPADSPSAAALSLLRAVASPGGRNDGAASSAGAELAAALAARPSFSFSSSPSSSSSSSPSPSIGIGGWKGFLLDEVVVGRNNPLARSVARGGSGEGGDSGGGGETSAAAASAAGAALAADLSALQSLAFDGAAAAAWVRASDPSVPPAWLDALAAAVDGGGGSKDKEGQEKEGKEAKEQEIVPLPRLLPPLSRAQRARAAFSLSSHGNWADGAPDLISLWSRHGSGNVGSYFAFEWNPSSNPNLITPSAEDRGGGVVSGNNEKFDGAAAAAWEPVASRLAAWARGDRLSPFDGGAFAARLELPPSSFSQRGSGSGGDESDDDDDKDKEKKKDKKKKQKEESSTSSSSSSTSPLPSLSLWDGLRTSPVLLASGARLVRLPAVGSNNGSSSLPLRSLWRALRLHPRARWVVVSDSFPPGGGSGEAAVAMEGELPPGVALAVRKR